MNLRAVGWLLGCVSLLLGAFLLVPALLGVLFEERQAAVACSLTALFAAVMGGLLVWWNRGSITTAEGHLDYFRREGLAVVGVSWLLAAAIGAMPFALSGVIPSPVDALFESASGFTTTGSTVLDAESIDGMPRTIAFWRSFTHWLGGIGIVLVFVLLFPTGGRSLFRSEVPGIAREASHQRVRDSALALVRVYIGLSAVQFVLLMLAGLDWFDSAVHTFGTLATGGFSSHSESVAYFDSWLVEAIIIVFMFAAGLNFALYDTAIRVGPKRGLRIALGSAEVRVYVLMTVVATVIFSSVLWFWGGSNGDPTSSLPDYRSMSLALRDSSFLTVSLQTSTGYGSADFDRWPEVCRMGMMFLAFVGACAGSTGGGLKVVRFLIVGKAAVRGIRRFARPRAIHAVRIDGDSLDEGVVASVTGYFGLWVIVAVLGTLAMAGMGLEPITAFTSVLATLNNIGPGLNAVGPYLNFGDLPELGKLLLTFFMILGRLEFYAVVVLLVPSFWRR